MIQVNPLSAWLSHRDEYLSELLRHEGRQLDDGKIRCEGCGVDARLYRCRECIGNILLCALCLGDGHKRLPLHVIEVREVSTLW